MSLAGKRKEIEPLAPPEIMLAFFEHLDARSLGRAAQVCREWRALAKRLIKPARLREGLVECLRVLHTGDDEIVAKCRDGFATGSNSGMVSFWSKRGEPIASAKYHMQRVIGMTTFDGLFVCGDVRGRLCFWNAEGRSFQTLSDPDEDLIASMASCRSFVATIGSGSNFDEVILWKLDGLWGRLRFAVDPRPSARCHLAGDAERDAIFVASRDGLFAAFFDSRSISKTRPALEWTKIVGLDLRVSCPPATALTATKGLLIVAFADLSCAAWTIGEGRCDLRSVMPPTHGWDVLAVGTFGTLIATGAKDNEVHLRREGDKRPLAVLKGHRNAVTSLADLGDVLASVSRDRSVHLWGVPE